MTCSICSSPYHTRANCPMKDAMKRTALILAALMLSGCSALKVSFVGTVSYNADAETAATIKHEAAK